MADNARDQTNDDIVSRQENAPLLHAPNEPSEPRPKDAWLEVQLLLKQCPPLVVTYLLQFFPSILATLIAGHLSADDLAAASIGATTIAIFGSAFISGMATALDTLCAQSHGSGDLHGVGLHAQKMVLLTELACVPIGAFWIASPHLLSFVVKQPHLALKAGTFLRISAIGLPAQALYEAARRFLQVQGDFHTAMLIIALCTPVNALLGWVFAFPLGLGLDGAALGSSLSQILRAALLLLYIASARGSWSHRCWGGFSRDALRGWGLMARLSFAGSVATLSEYAAFEILCFTTSYMSTNHLAAQSILTTTSIVVWHVPFSISVFSSNRIGHLVGAGLVEAARRAAVVHGAACLAAGCLSGAVTFLFRRGLPRMFTNDVEVLRICVETIVAVCFFQVAEAMLCGTNGMLRGLGRQSFAAENKKMIVLASMPIPYADWLKPTFVEAWERSNAIMRHRYGDRLPIWMRRKSRCQRLLEMVPYGARTEVIANIGGLIAIGALVVFIFIMWEVRNMSVANCKKLCLA
ncbi:mate efflux family protein subfamily [Colletotrichum kahawae]|uniref:Mate efflux family protein subfamily n=1 Tax=Colletotrichum kahawae TaxID=34407 RepID=A0AAD9YAS6_COLKA|nr:mate efflux family protein subfamily [Colletotrichum kahawae]